MSCKLSVCCILIYLLSLAVSAQNVIRVAPNGVSDGSTWAKASNIKDAIANADSGDELWLRQGTYIITETLEIDFSLKIYGGYSGVGNQRNPENHQSILSGNNKVSILEITSRASDVLLDGLYFENGLARSEDEIGDRSEGGALSLRGDGSVILNCVFRNNNSRNSMGSGAIYIWADDVLVENCIFESNRVLENFSGNGNIGGGAIQLRFGDNNEIKNCIFKDNSSYYDGGAIYSFAYLPKIIDCVFEKNTSDGDGGAIFLNNNELTIANSVFKDNYSKINGGGLHANFGELTLENVRFENNEAEEYGGALYNNFGTIKITNSLFFKNQAVEGGGIYNAEAIELSNVNFISNEHTALVLSSNSSTKVFNSIFYKNTSLNSYPNANPDIDIGMNISYGQLEALEIRRNILQNTPRGGTVGGNQINIDPLFVNFGAGNYKLQHLSPAVDSGAKSFYNAVSSANAASTKDLGGIDRLFGDNIDIGAFEYFTSIACTNLTQPLNGSTEVELNATMQWDAIAEATGYRISVGTTPGGTEIVNNQDLGNTTSFTPSVELPEGSTVYVRVTPYNEAGDATNCSEESFTTTTKLKAPKCTQLTQPLNGSTEVELNTTMQWDAIAEATGYRISIGTTPGGTEIVNNQDLGNTTSFTPSVELPEGSTIYVRMTPYNEAGDASNCSEERFTTTTKLKAPACTQLTQPLNGSTEVELNTTMQWEAIAEATGYRISIGTTPGGTELVNNQDLGNTTSFTPSVELPEGSTIYVRMTPYNEAGDASNCSEERFTTTTKLKAPVCTSLTQPLDGATGVELNATLEWNSVTEATGYRISVGTTPGGTELVNNQDLGNTTSFTPSVELPEGSTIYVRMTPYNEAGDATNCSEERFTTTTKLKAPACTSLTQPLDGATGIELNTTLQWNSIAEATGYRISIGTTPGGTELVNNQDLSNTTSFTPSVEFPEGSTIYVRVIPYNEAGDATNCSEERFTTTTKLKAPACTSLTQPLDGATGIELNTTLQWNSIAEATGYRISVGTTPSGTEIVNNQDLGNTTSFTPSVEFPEGSTIYVRVIPYNEAGDATNCSEERFTTTTKLKAPECTQLTQPLNGSTEVELNATMQWNSISEATGYRISIGTTPGGTEIVNNQDLGNTTSFTPSVEFPEGSTIYVRVIPYNEAGDATSCSEERFTTTTKLKAPACTQLTQPLNGSTEVELNATLQWNSISEATGYRISVGTTPGGTEIVNNQDLGNTTSFTPSVEFPEGSTIYVRVIPYNEAGDATSCSEERFTTTTKLKAPACTQLTQPLNGSTEVELNATIQWDAIAEATGYRISVGTTPGGTELVNNQDLGNTTSFTPSVELPEGSTIYVRVTPYNAAGDATNCSEERFTTVQSFDLGLNKYGVSPNGDSINDFWEIPNIENYSDNVVTIYNRWGNVVFKVEGYDNQSLVFNGIANMNTSIGGGELPDGTYFFEIMVNQNGNSKAVKGFLVLKR